MEKAGFRRTAATEASFYVVTGAFLPPIIAFYFFGT